MNIHYSNNKINLSIRNILCVTFSKNNYNIPNIRSMKVHSKILKWVHIKKKII